jgi:hypothetical protein
VEDPAKRLVEKGVLRDFSIGILDPQIVYGDFTAPGGVIKGGKIGEVSLVDRGSNKNTTFEIVKSLGGRAVLVGRTRRPNVTIKAVHGKPIDLSWVDRDPEYAAFRGGFSARTVNKMAGPHGGSQPAPTSLAALDSEPGFIEFVRSTERGRRRASSDF